MVLNEGFLFCFFFWSLFFDDDEPEKNMRWLKGIFKFWWHVIRVVRCGKLFKMVERLTEEFIIFNRAISLNTAHIVIVRCQQDAQLIIALYICECSWKVLACILWFPCDDKLDMKSMTTMQPIFLYNYFLCLISRSVIRACWWQPHLI